MTTFTLASLNTAIESTLVAATGIKRGMDAALGELIENIPEGDMPLIQVYPSQWSIAANSSTQKNTFGASPVIQRTFVFNVDVYVSGRQLLGENLQTMITLASALSAVLDAQQTKTPFGTDAIKSFQYEAQRGVINFSGKDYQVIQYTLTVEVF